MNQFTQLWPVIRKNENQAEKPGSSIFDIRKHQFHWDVRKYQLDHSVMDLIENPFRANEFSHSKTAKLLGVNLYSVEPAL